MNTNALKKFAQDARRKLMEQVGSRLEYVLNNDTSELREKAKSLAKLQKEIQGSSKEQVVEKVAYTWFNRFVALRFMDANGYQPIGTRVLSPKEGFTIPELLDEAKKGHLFSELDEYGLVDKNRLYGLLDGKIPSGDPQNDAYKLLLIGACNHLSEVFPFLFERIDDYAELLLPTDLTSEFSILHDVLEGMPLEDCQEVEIIGWLYQFYISEKKDEVFAKKGKVEADEIPAATQLFTPRWIVEYMVQNTLGKLWLQNRPQSSLKEYMPYYIESPSSTAEDYLKLNSPEELTLLDQACGSGHILVYGFDLLAKIYEEEGYSNSEIPQLIIEKNLFGFEIDERAAQLSGFALMMKAREYYRRVFRKSLSPQILCYQNSELKSYLGDKNAETFFIDSNKLKAFCPYQYVLAKNVEVIKKEAFLDDDTGETVKIERVETFQKKGSEINEKTVAFLVENHIEGVECYVDEVKDVLRTLGFPFSSEIYRDLREMTFATNFGSLIMPWSSLKSRNALLQLATEEIAKGTIHNNKLLTLKKALEQLALLGRKYHCIVDNPPYMGGGNMNKELADFVKHEYPDSKADLMACFMEAGLKMLEPKGFLGMVNQQSWMFLSSYESMRKKMLQGHTIDSLIQIGYNSFPELNSKVVQCSAFCIVAESELKKGVYFNLNDVGQSENKRNVFVDKLESSSFYTANQNDFQKIPGSPIGYWLSEMAMKSFAKYSRLSVLCDTKKGLATSDNNRFLKSWFEVKNEDTYFNRGEEKKWFPHHKGGARRKWFGNHEFVINWENDGDEIKNFKDSNGKLRSRPQNLNYNLKQAVTWSKITSGDFSSRICSGGFLFDDASAICYNSDFDVLKKVNLFLNSKVSQVLLNSINPTLNIQIGDIGGLPVNIENDIKVHDNCLVISQSEWNSRETSWDFTTNELLKQNKSTLAEAYEGYCAHWQEQFEQLHANEEALNKEFIEIYGLQEELTPDVALKDITILRDEVDQKQLGQLSEAFGSGWELSGDQWHLKNENPYANFQLPFDQAEIIKQFISYAVGCMFGRYSLDKEGLVLANQGETLKEYIEKVGAEALSLTPDEDNIIPLLNDEWFEDDIVAQFQAFLKASFGSAHFSENLRFVEDALGKTLRKYFIADFYKEHIKRYKKRPIYWQFSSPKGSFNALIYMHRYTPDTLNRMLNGYLRELQEKVRSRMEHLEQVSVSGSSAEQTKAIKEKEKYADILRELQAYEREILYPIATERIPIDLDDGVLVNYNKFGAAIKDVAGLNDKKAKDKVKQFDWTDTSLIR
ncbi:BREX-1 system adenine-specific DNA-methyltransferase PglX [Flammeovirgaceae bacterium SG7u.111]|nr:BREX-1 system adenine-specific DNA-methyltransferase PglX [Flammeovirgaceae bacterium SG7u.132]WPO34626.1 BREX-1 system adenine-specific DNA-methyltransferase PglX [Flammeovirgaceae bacterium SG7u.111]